nr:ribonuclease H-like domain-containing protein [Tanacetum cinerariifolium]
MKGIKREFSVARTPQQNGVAKRKNRTRIKAARTMLADSLLPISFWAEAVNTACYVQNRVLVTKPHNKTPYELILGIGPKWLFDIDTLTQSINYQPVVAGNQPNDNADDDVVDVSFDVKENENDVHVSPSGSDKTDNKKDDEKAKRDDKGKSHVDSPIGVRDLRAEFEEFSFNNTNRVNVVIAPVNAAGPNLTSTNIASPSVNAVCLNFGIAGKYSFVDPSKYPDDPDMPELEDIVYSNDEEEVGVEADLSNLETNIPVSPIPTTRVYKDHPVTQIIDLPRGKRAIGLKWVFRNKKDERGIVIRKKARLMDVKSAFLYETIEEEVYVCQPPGFEDTDYPDKVYKVVKALYGLHQAPRDWYETLANYLLENGFQGRKID